VKNCALYDGYRRGKVQTLLEWTIGLEYWTDIFVVFTHVLVG